MMMIPIDARERALAMEWFLDEMARGGLTIFDADDMLAQLRLAGDVANLERLSRALSSRMGAGASRPHPSRPAPPAQYSFE